MFSQIRFRLFLGTFLSLFILISSVSGQNRIVITWFVGLGTGTNEQQIAAQNQVVADFNASQDAIELVINIGADFTTSRDTFSTLIAAGTPPDIVGPVGVGGSNAFNDIWADLNPLVEATAYDLSAFDPALVDLYRTADGQLLGIPFAVFPSVTYYNRDLFDEAGLNYPPSEFGMPYVLPDGTELPWDYDTVAYIAGILTVNAVGDSSYDFTDCWVCAGSRPRIPLPPPPPPYMPDDIVQFGMNFQWAQQRLMWTQLQPEVLYNADSNTIEISQSWRDASVWLQGALWTGHFMPNNSYAGSDLFGAGNVFQSGNLGMAITPLWYTCCLSESVGNFNWDFAVVPQGFDGAYHVATDADTFRLTKGSANPEAAFTVLSYLLNEAVPSLAPVYGAYPARPEYQANYIDSLTNRYPFLVNTNVPAASLAYNNPGEMHHEAFTPNWQQVSDRIQAFSTLLFGDTGADIDVNAELDALEADLNQIVGN